MPRMFRSNPNNLAHMRFSSAMASSLGVPGRLATSWEASAYVTHSTQD
jgi:hypothetical protein